MVFELYCHPGMKYLELLRLAASTRFSELLCYWSPMKIMILLQSQHPSLSVRNLKVFVAEFRSSLWNCPVWYQHLVCNLGFLWLYLRTILSSETTNSKEIIIGPGKYGGTVYRDDSLQSTLTLHTILYTLFKRKDQMYLSLDLTAK